MIDELQQARSYKDPAGFVVKLADGYHRLIMHNYAPEFDHLIQSGLYQNLIDQDLMLPHVEVPLTSENPNLYKEVYPRQLGFISYPFEWSYTQWHQVMLTFIRINQIALNYGMILKDATPYNFTFDNNNCLLIDTLSFRFYRDNEPWLAYRQFCEEMLSPFLLMHYKDVTWAKLYRTHSGGLPLAFVSKHLPFYTRFTPFCLIHIHLHAKFQQPQNVKQNSDGGLTKDKLQALFNIIHKAVDNRKQPLAKNSIWDDYYQTDIESETYLVDKTNVVTNWLDTIKPDVTVDLGANTGKFSLIAAQASNHVYAIENDGYCIDKLYHNLKKTESKNITTVVADITEPSPGIGWDNKEKAPLLQRITCDNVMALALIHHLCLGKNIPLHFVAKLLANITTRFAIVEFVPKTDAKSKLLLKNKGDIFEKYTERGFIESFGKYFKLSASHTCKDSVRTLFLWEKI